MIGRVLGLSPMSIRLFVLGFIVVLFVFFLYKTGKNSLEFYNMGLSLSNSLREERKNMYKCDSGSSCTHA